MQQDIEKNAAELKAFASLVQEGIQEKLLHGTDPEFHLRLPVSSVDLAYVSSLIEKHLPVKVIAWERDSMGVRFDLVNIEATQLTMQLLSQELDDLRGSLCTVLPNDIPLTETRKIIRAAARRTSEDIEAAFDDMIRQCDEDLRESNCISCYYEVDASKIVAALKTLLERRYDCPFQVEWRASDMDYDFTAMYERRPEFDERREREGRLQTELKRLESLLEP